MSIKNLLLMFFFTFATTLYVFFVTAPNAYAVLCTCDPNTFQNEFSNVNAGAQGTFFYGLYCSNDCHSTYWNSNFSYTSGSCVNDNNLHPIYADWQNATCPPGIACDWSATNTCPPNYAATDSCTRGFAFPDSPSTVYTFYAPYCTYTGGQPGGQPPPDPAYAGCTIVRQYPECEIGNNVFCAFNYDNHGGSDMDWVTQYNCPWANPVYTCNPDANQSCNGGISGHVYIDYNRDQSQDNGEPNANSSQLTAIGAGTGGSTNGGIYSGGTYSTTTDANGNFNFPPYQQNGVVNPGVAYSGLIGGNYTIGISFPPKGYYSNNLPVQRSLDYTNTYSARNSNGGVNGLSFGIVPVYTIGGKVTDSLGNPISGVNVHVFDFSNGQTTNTTQTLSDGTYFVSGLVRSEDWYAVRPGGGNLYPADCPTGYICDQTQSSPNPWSYEGNNGGGFLGPDCGQNCNFVYKKNLFSISGTVYNDPFRTQHLGTNAGVNGVSVTAVNTSTGVPVTGSPFTTGADGKYTFTNLPAGQYSVSITLPSGYFMTYILGDLFTPTVGNASSPTPCNANGYNDTSCDASGNILGLNFGIANTAAFTQPICSDARYGGGYKQQLPATANCGGTSEPYAIAQNTNLCPVHPGILFSGNADPVYGGGLGASKVGNYQVGNSTFPETFTSSIPNTIGSSWSFVNTTINNLSTPPTPLVNICPSLINCVLSEATPGGVYTTTALDGPVSISVSNLDGTTQLGKANYTFLVKGDLTFTSNVALQNGYAAAFISGGTITVASNIGETTWTSVTPDLQGFYSADSNFHVQAANASDQQCLGSGQPKEKKLNVKGVVIAGAGGAGSIVNDRDGCIQDATCPVITYTEDPLQLLHAPGPLKPPNTFWQELSP